MVNTALLKSAAGNRLTGSSPVLPTNQCLNCSKNISKNAKRCKSCTGLLNKTKIKWPSKKELEKLVWEKPMTVLSEELGVSDNAISKRCKRLQIKKPPRGYWLK